MNWLAISITLGVSFVAGGLLYLPFFIWFRWRRSRPEAVPSTSVRITGPGLFFFGAMILILFAGVASGQLSPQSWFGAQMQTFFGVLGYMAVVCMAAGVVERFFLKRGFMFMYRTPHVPSQGVPSAQVSGNATNAAINDVQWKAFFVACAEILGRGGWNIETSLSWCSWTTFSRLREDAGYWQCGFPPVDELQEKGTTDGGTWSQPFLFADIAHLFVPKIFTRELFVGEETEKVFQRVRIAQDIEALSRELVVRGVPHVLTPMGLEMRGVFTVDPNGD